MKPEYMAQTAEPMPPSDATQWLKDRILAFIGQGAKTIRISTDDRGTTIVEGWREPIVGDLPEPAFAYVADHTPGGGS